MKIRKKNYTFSKPEIEILKQISNGNHTLAQIREALSIKPSLLSHYLKELQEKRLIKIQQEPAFEKNLSISRKCISFQDTKHSSILKELLARHSHIKWENILSGLGIDVLFQIMDDSDNIEESMSIATFWRYSKDLMASGIVVNTDGNLHINERFSLLKNFLEEYRTFTINALIGSVSDNAVLLWQKDFEFLIRVPKTMQVTQKGFKKTATSRFDGFGIQLMSDFDIYFYSKRETTIVLEDVLLHTLLIEKGNVRYMTYGLLLLEKELNRINKDYLLKKATWYDLNLQVVVMFEYLRTRGARTGQGFPTWNEFANKMRDYQMEAMA